MAGIDRVSLYICIFYSTDRWRNGHVKQNNKTRDNIFTWLSDKLLQVTSDKLFGHKHCDSHFNRMYTRVYDKFITLMSLILD